MMANVPHVISGLGLRKFQADGFLLTRVYNQNLTNISITMIWCIKLLTGISVKIYYIFVVYMNILLI